jgi:hypothetical protein
MEDNLDALFARLAKSKFRSRFELSVKDINYIRQKGIEIIERHAGDFITKRLAPAEPKNDGRQTPTKGHPVFIAQHATGTCCRKCLQKWHNINQNKPLSDSDVNYIVLVLIAWIKNQVDICGSGM